MKKKKVALLGLVLTATCIFVACKKEISKSQEPILPKQPLLKLLPREDADVLVGEVNQFVKYAAAYSLNPNAAIPDVIASGVNDDDAVSYLENTFNFLYIQQEDLLTKSMQDSLVIEIPKNAAGRIDAPQMAAAFSSLYTHVSAAYKGIGCPDDEKVLRVVDVSIMSSNLERIRLKLCASFSYAYKPGTATPSPSSITFGSTEGWSIWCEGGSLTLPPGMSPGAPEKLNEYLRANMGGYLFLGPVFPKTKFRRFVVSGVVSCHFGTWAWSSGCRVTSANPWIAAKYGLTGFFGFPKVSPHYAITDFNALVFYGLQYPNTEIPDYDTELLNADLLNYILAQSELVLRNKETSLGLSLWNLKLSSNEFPLGFVTPKSANYYMNTEFAKVIDFSTLPTPIVPAPEPFGAF